MVELDREELFLALRKPLSGISDEKKASLRESGYIDPDGEITAPGRDLLDGFIREREDIVYQALMSSVDDFEAYYRLRDAGWFKHHQAFLEIVRYLGSQGRILKKN